MPFFRRSRPGTPSIKISRTGIEPLEERIAPASLISGTSLKYTDSDGDQITVNFSKSVLKSTNVNKIFRFDTGTVDHHTTLHQQLETINLTALGKTAAHLNVTVLVKQAGSGDGLVNVGYVNGSGIDLGTITVNGDLGRIAAGDNVTSTPGLAKLAVDSMGAKGVSTQASGGTLSSLINGALTSLVITGDLNGASISVGATTTGDGSIGQVFVGGSVLGASAQYSGSIRATGNIGPVHVVGDVQGGGGQNSGLIGTTGQMGTVNIDGSLLGGSGTGSGSVLSTLGTGAVTIGGDVKGGSAANTGDIGTAGTLASVTIHGGLQGGGGNFSGAVLSTGKMGAVVITGDITGSSGSASGQVGSAADIFSISAGNLIGGSSDHTGGVYAGGKIGTVTVASIQAGQGSASGSVIAAGTMGNVQVTGDVTGNLSASAGVISSGGQMGTVMAADLVGTRISSGGPMGDLTVSGAILSSTVTASGDLGKITAGAQLSDSSASVNGIDSSIFQAGGSIGAIESYGAAAVTGSAFDSLQNIGDLTLHGSLQGSLFIAGLKVFNFAPDLSGTGDLSQSSVLLFGFENGGQFANSAASIGKVTLVAADSNSAVPGISDTTFLSGLYSADGFFGTLSDPTVSGSSIGDITAGAMNHVGLESGALGKTTAVSITNVTGIATDSNGNGIGDIQAGTMANPDAGISGSTFISNAAIGKVTAYATGTAISTSKFLSNADLGAITALTTDPTAQSHAISGSGFNAYGNIGDISATGDIASSLFIAGFQLGANFASDVSGAGTTNFGFGGSVFNNHYNYGDSTIGKVTLGNPAGSSLKAGISHSTFTAGVEFSNNADGSDYTPGSNSAIGNITAPGGLDTVVFNSGAIGSTFVAAGHIVDAVYSANTNFGNGIGTITVMTAASTPQFAFVAHHGLSPQASLPPSGNGHAIDSSTFISNAVIGSIDAEAPGTGSAITNSHFRAATSFNNLTAVSSDAVNAIDSSIFTTGGNISTISVTGGISASQILAGVDLGSSFAYVTAANSGASIGNVTFTGKVLDTDIIASVLPYNSKTTYGNEQTLQDTNVGSGGSIGVVSIDTSEASPLVQVNPYNNSGEIHGIEAMSIASASVGKNAAVAVPVDNGGSEIYFGSGEQVPDEAIRQITFNG